MRFEKAVDHWVARFPPPWELQRGRSIPRVSHEQVDAGIAHGRELHGAYCRRAANAVLVQPVGVILRIAGRSVAALAKGLEIERARLATSRSLSALDDRMLRDIGIDRGDIPYVAGSLARAKAGEQPPAVESAEPEVAAPPTLPLRAA